MLSREQVQSEKGEASKRMMPEAVARARQDAKETADDAKQLINAGMKRVFGSDSGSAGRGFGWYIQLELESWIPTGFSPSQAIVIETRDSAIAGTFNTGMVATGKSADFIVLDASSLDDIANTRKSNKVYLRGQDVDGAGLRAKWQAQWNRKTK